MEAKRHVSVGGYSHLFLLNEYPDNQILIELSPRNTILIRPLSRGRVNYDRLELALGKDDESGFIVVWNEEQDGEMYTRHFHLNRFELCMLFLTILNTTINELNENYK